MAALKTIGLFFWLSALQCAVKVVDGHCANRSYSRRTPGADVTVCWEGKDSHRSGSRSLNKALQTLSDVIDQNRNFWTVVQSSADTLTEIHKGREEHEALSTSLSKTIKNVRKVTFHADHSILQEFNGLELAKTLSQWCDSGYCSPISVSLNFRPGANGTAHTLEFGVKVFRAGRYFSLLPVRLHGGVSVHTTLGSPLSDTGLDVEGEIRLPLLRSYAKLHLSLGTKTGFEFNVEVHFLVFRLSVHVQFLPTEGRHFQISAGLDQHVDDVIGSVGGTFTKKHSPTRSAGMYTSTYELQDEGNGDFLQKCGRLVKKITDRVVDGVKSAYQYVRSLFG